MSTSWMLLGLIRPLCVGALARPEGICVAGMCEAAGLVVVAHLLGVGTLQFLSKLFLFVISGALARE